MALFQSVMRVHMMHTSWIIVGVISSYIDSHEAGAQSWAGRAFSVQWRNFSSHFYRMRPFSVTISIIFQCKHNKISFSLLRCYFDALNQCGVPVLKRPSSHLQPTSLQCMELSENRSSSATKAIRIDSWRKEIFLNCMRFSAIAFKPLIFQNRNTHKPHHNPNRRFTTHDANLLTATRILCQVCLYDAWT